LATQLATTDAPQAQSTELVQAPGTPEAQRFALLQRQARMFASSPLVPEHLRKGPPEVAMANCYIALTLAEAMGELPLIVMQNIHFVHGVAGFKSEYKIARANRSGIFSGRIDWRVDKSDPNNMRVTAYAHLKDTGEEVSFECDMAMAKAEKWTSNSKYQTMPEVMLRYRSASFLIRFYAGDVMLGYQTLDEIEDIIASATPSNPLTAAMLIEQARGGGEPIEQQSPGADDAPIFSRENDALNQVDNATFSDDAPAAGEGPSDDQRGEQHNDTDTSAADDLIARVQSAAIIGDVIGIESNYQSGGRDMFETLDQDRIETAIAEAKTRLKGGK
jgi:hypothetical protein